MSPPCPVCGGRAEPFTSRDAFGETWNILRCTECGHGFVENRPTRERLAEIYSTIQDQPAGLISPVYFEAQIDAAALAERIAKFVPPQQRGKALDVGCGSGAFSFHLARQGFSPILMIDYDARLEAATRFIPKSRFRTAAFEDITASDGPFAAIIMSQVLKHALDPLDWLRRAGDLLAPQGVLAIAVPNFGGVYRFLGARDPFLIPPIHLNFFTAASMRKAMTMVGLHPLAFSSRSNITLGKGAKRLAGLAWNAVSGVLNPTCTGIILWAFADCPAPPSSGSRA